VRFHVETKIAWICNEHGLANLTPSTSAAATAVRDLCTAVGAPLP
jgi:hypothetical protein